MIAGLVQYAAGADYKTNIDRSIDGIRNAAQQDAQLVLLQELHAHRYFCRHEDPRFFEVAEPIPGPTTNTLSEIASELSIVIVASVFEQRLPGLYHNTAVVLERDGTIAGLYRKMHIPDDPGYYEKYYFTPGDLGFHPIQTSVGKLGILICWDQWFPEAARLMALANAQILIYPTAIGWNPDDDKAEQLRQLQAWQIIQRSHAIANGLPLMCCNRMGTEGSKKDTPAIKFWGSSFVCGPQGELLAEAPIDHEAATITEIDLQGTDTIRREWPFLRDRRIDYYGDLTQLSRNTKLDKSLSK